MKINHAHFKPQKLKLVCAATLMPALLLLSSPLYAVSSANIPLDSPVYLYLEKLAGCGLIVSDIKGLKPFSKSEVARLVLEAESNLATSGAASSAFAAELIKNIRSVVPREVALLERPSVLPLRFDFDPVSSLRLRSVLLDGAPRDYTRTSWDPAHQSAFGLFGGDLRPLGNGGPVHVTGTEGTPLLENNNGLVYHRGVSGEVRWAAEAYISHAATVLVEPVILASGDAADILLNRGYVKLGGGGLELEVGRDENWFGPGYRGTTTLTNNAHNFDLVKLSSPEPLDIGRAQRWRGNIKYSLIVSRFDETDVGTANHRQPYFIGTKVAIKPNSSFEFGANFVRQQGGPGFSGTPDTFLGGGKNDHSNSIAGFDVRWRIPGLRNTELYGEYSGEDNAGGVWPIVESYVAGLYVPCVTDSCRDDFRFEYFFGSVMLYGDWQFPRGYVYHDMTPGHSQGGAGVQDFFLRYSHWFDVRNRLAMECFYTERGRWYRTAAQVMEAKYAGRMYWDLPLYGDINGQLGYGIEKIDNVNLVNGAERINQLLKFEMQYKY
ncbi:MAG: capsule assembly Wzi family protein [Desulfuromonadaceae bacterium]|nr:capsule assembly Wzi family protein [Desulfuromonadaceae bacterium]